MPSTVFLCLYLPSPPHHQMHGHPARLSRFRIMTFSIQQAKRFYYRPGRVPLRKGPLLRAQGVLMSELLMTPRVRACMYIVYTTCVYLYIILYQQLPYTYILYDCIICIGTLPIHIIYLYVYCVCRLHLAASPSPPPPHRHQQGAAIIFCVSPRHRQNRVAYYKSRVINNRRISYCKSRALPLWYS